MQVIEFMKLDRAMLIKRVLLTESAPHFLCSSVCKGGNTRTFLVHTVVRAPLLSIIAIDTSTTRENKTNMIVYIQLHIRVSQII